MRIVLALLIACTPLFAQGMPPAKRIDSWTSPYNQKRLRLQWEILPKFEGTKLPDGSEEPPKAPWPFLIYIQQVDSKANDKLNDKVFADARFAIACHGVKPIKLRPDKALDLPYLARVQGIKDPTVIAVGRDFEILGVLNSASEFTDRKVLGLMADAAESAYEKKLGAYVNEYFKLMKEEEELWQDEKKMEELRTKAANADGGKSEKYDKEADELEKLITPKRTALADEEVTLQDSLALTDTGAPDATPDRVKVGGRSRKLTPAEIEAIDAFKQFARSDNGVVRAAAVEDLGAIDSAVMVQFILKAANDTDERVVKAAGKGLGRMKSDESMEAILAGLSDGNSRARMAALYGFGRVQRAYPPAVQPIIAKATGGDDDQRRAAIEALVNLEDPSAIPTLIGVLDDSETALRVITATALGEMKAEAAVPKLCAMLEASDWSEQKAAAEALAKIRVKESIEPILAAFEKAEGLLMEVLHKSLTAITGQDFLYRKDAWRTWWDKYSPGFKVPTEAEVAAKKKQMEEAMKGYHDPRKKRFTTIETLSEKMIFVIDISASMNDKIVIPAHAPEEVRAQFPDRVKMNIAKKELITLLATLEPNVFFNIITFAGKVKPWREGLVPGSQRNAAIKFVDKLEAMQPPRGGRKQSSGEEQRTNTYGALMEAFGLEDEPTPGWKSRTKVDTIFLVTDGVPTVGQITDPPKLVDAITEINAARGVVIHVVVFDEQEAKKLGPLATRNGGQCVIRGWSGEAK